MLTEEQIQNNKCRYINLIKSINRDGSRIDDLLSWLNSSDFFIAPASVKYHNSFVGGLCSHSLNVYDNLMHLVNDWHLDKIISADSCKIVALCHDFSKINFYKTEIRNRKVYSENGSKRDEQGKFDWVAVKEFTYREANERFVFGNHESTSEYMVRGFFPLTYVESTAILHHHAGMSLDCAKDNLSDVFNQYTLALLLHIADTLSTYVNEGPINTSRGEYIESTNSTTT